MVFMVEVEADRSDNSGNATILTVMMIDYRELDYDNFSKFRW